MKNELSKKYKRSKYIKLILALAIDLIGVATYILPAIGESGDFVWAPISGMLIVILFPNRKKIAIGGALEELLPFADFIPTALIAWSLDYIKDNKKTLAAFEKNQMYEELKSH